MKSIWQKEIDISKVRPSLDGDRRTDVLIIGGGIAGILTAHFLSERGIPYILIEKGRILERTTAHTTAKITVGHGFIYDRLINEFGLGVARGYYQSNREAYNKYVELSEKYSFDFEKADNYVYSSKSTRRVEAELYALERIGAKADFVENIKPPVRNYGAVRIKNEAQMNPLKLLCQLSQGLNIFENTKALSIDGKTVTTTGGKITAENIVVATHFPFIDRYGFYFLKMYQERSYVLALEGAEAVSGMYVDGECGGMSFRNYGDLLLLGGGGHRTGKRGGGFDELRAFYKAHYSGAKEVAAWATQDTVTLDGMPYIGRYSRRTSNIFVATGFNKWGMTGGMLSAMLLADEIEGKRNPYSEIYSPDRSIWRTQLFKNIGETLVNFLLPLPRRCTHLGCTLKWNKDEHSWDCACHGSRFSEEGKVLDGPANKDR